MILLPSRKLDSRHRDAFKALENDTPHIIIVKFLPTIMISPDFLLSSAVITAPQPESHSPTATGSWITFGPDISRSSFSACRLAFAFALALALALVFAIDGRGPVSRWGLPRSALATFPSVEII